MQDWQGCGLSSLWFWSHFRCSNVNFQAQIPFRAPNDFQLEEIVIVRDIIICEVFSGLGYSPRTHYCMGS